MKIQTLRHVASAAMSRIWEVVHLVLPANHVEPNLAEET